MFLSAGAPVHVFSRSLDMKQKQQQQQQHPKIFNSSELAALLEVTLPESEEASFTWPTTQLNITFKEVFDKVKESNTSKRTITPNFCADTCIVLPNDKQAQKTSCNENEIGITPPPRQSRMGDPFSDGRHEANVNGDQR
jgi:hypothetical protein